jgi:hypothetical protein
MTLALLFSMALGHVICQDSTLVLGACELLAAHGYSWLVGSFCTIPVINGLENAPPTHPPANNRA